MNLRLKIIIVAIGFIVLCAGFLFLGPSLKLAWYDLQTLSARKQIQTWLAEPQQARTSDEMLNAEQILKQANDACPQLAQYPIALAQLHILQSFGPKLSQIERHAHYQQAIAYFHKALNAQANNYYSMANIVQFKAYLGQYDPDFENYFLLSRKLAPHEEDIQLTLLNAAYLSWNKLSPQMRKETLALESQARSKQNQQVEQLRRNFPTLAQ
ncbi:hypothetical protein NT239_14995 [Chitinibacter sp. SCUT-21]|uniref:hypothetical protein n=1 Tax=Chitinibacter sp. SCUT-21 TaxID=2970891 RepID=UPI0035A579D0